ncbi:MAG: polysaccharide biosynthesis tyrosine autokinase [Leptolyngbyaceae cyanobacterium SU_3_3]|nr:polysaccharide biosynthesis tyrosine autokinase [Leptolyngbyaceae cyanobacterium SU_3_3]
MDQLAQGYLRYSQQERQSNLRQGIQFVNQQITQNQRRVDSLQRELQDFRQKNNFVDPDTQVNRVAQQSGGLEQKRIENEREIAEAQTSYNNLQGRVGAVSALAADAAYQSFLMQLREIDSKIAIESARFQDDNPALDALRDQRRNLLPILRQEARRVLGNKLAESENQLSVLETRRRSISNAEQYIDRQGQRLPVVARLYADLQRELDVATASLNRFLQTRENLQVGAAQKEVPWQLIAPPELPGSPEDLRSRNLMLGGLAGLLLGITAALLADKLDNTLRTAPDLKRHAKLPILGTIPYNPELRQNAIVSVIPRLLQVDRLRESLRSQPKSSYYTAQVFSESFRSLYTNILLLNSNTPIKSITIGSALPGEGKSTVAMHLAQAAAAMGQRVLLVDADLRNPQVTKLLDLPNETGLSDLIQTDLHPEQVIRPVYQSSPSLVGSSAQSQSAATQNLFAVASGQIEVDPTRLLSSLKMRQLVEYFHKVFDLVIYDTPPLLSLADSSLLATHTDGMIVVAALGKTDRASLAETLDSLKTRQIPIWGVVANTGRKD